MKPAIPSSGKPSATQQPAQSQASDDDRDDVDASDDADDSRQPSAADRLAEVSRLMRGGDDDEGDDDADDGAPARKPSDKSKVRTVAQAAKLLGLEVEQLYELEIPLRVASGERKTIKLSELKDYHDGQDEHSLERIAWEEERGREHADIARSRAELSELLNMIPADKLDKSVTDRIRARHDGLIKLEKQKTLQRIPAWVDDDRRESDIAGIAEHLADYGFPANALQGIHDHRMLAYMRDNWLRVERLKAALEKVKPVRHGAPARGKHAGKAPSREPVRPSGGTRTVDRQVADISKILRG